MALYRRADSPYWWMVLSRPGQRPLWRSTKIPHTGASKHQAAELKRQALQVYAHEQAQLTLKQKGLTEPEPVTVVAHLRWYAEHHASAHRGARQERHILTHLERAFADTLLADLTADQVLEWRTARRRQGVSASTVNRELAVLKSAIASAVPAHLTRSPIAGVAYLHQAATVTHLLSRDQETALLAELPFADQVLIIAALDTLMRLGDLLRLQVSHDRVEYLLVPDPKGGTAYTVPVSQRLRLMLNQLTPDANGFYFHHRRTAKQSRAWNSAVLKMLQRACARAKIPLGLTFHGLRHTGATRLIAAGVDLRTVQELGGWASMTMLSRYVHPTERAKKQAVELIGVDVTVTPHKSSPKH